MLSWLRLMFRLEGFGPRTVMICASELCSKLVEGQTRKHQGDRSEESGSVSQCCIDLRSDHSTYFLKPHTDWC